jgi:hypothetical protein
MKHQFKPGDPALIRPNKKVPHLVGKSVELVLAVGPGESATYAGSLWHNTVGIEPSWIVTGEGLDCDHSHEGIRRRPDGLSFFRESLLMPLRGDFAPEDQRIEELTA